jgi:hypothetical protein
MPLRKTGTWGRASLRHQYSDGDSVVVELRSASLITQSFSPVRSVYADRSRQTIVFTAVVLIKLRPITDDVLHQKCGRSLIGFR